MKKNRLASFALFWYFANLLIESTILPLEIIYEHRASLPSIFLFATLTLLLYRTFRNRIHAFRVLAAVIILLLSLFTWQRNSIWSSEIGMWQDVISKSPGLSRAYVNLGKAYVNAGNYKEAEKNFRTGMAMEPEKAMAYLNLAISYDQLNRPEDSLLLLRQAATKTGDQAKVHNSLGIVLRKLGRYQEAMNAAFIALKINPNLLDAYITIGLCYQNTNQYDQAIGTWQDLAEKGLHNVDLYNNWAVSLLRTGHFEAAEEKLLISLILDPQHFESRYNLGVVYTRMGKMDKGRSEMEKALKTKRDRESKYIQ
ncbi:tetratricopeptide repeat protein [Thermodesulfobacteriota bacterium]